MERGKGKRMKNNRNDKGRGRRDQTKKLGKKGVDRGK